MQQPLEAAVGDPNHTLLDEPLTLSQSLVSPALFVHGSMLPQLPTAEIEPTFIIPSAASLLASQQ